MIGRLLAGAGVLALAGFLIVQFGNARYRQGQLAERVAAQPAAIATERRVAAVALDGRDRVIAAQDADTARWAARQPFVVQSHDSEVRYAQSPAGRVLCRDADRVREIDTLDARLFPAAAADSGALAPALPADPAVASGER